MTAIKNTVTEARVLKVIARLRDAEDNGLAPSRKLARDARECLAYLHAACREWPVTPATVLVVEGNEDTRILEDALSPHAAVEGFIRFLPERMSEDLLLEDDLTDEPGPTSKGT